MGTIVVGVDGSTGSDAALRWALDEASLRSARVRVVHAYQSPELSYIEFGGAGGAMGAPMFGEDAEEVHRAAEAEAVELIEDTLSRVGGDANESLEIERAAIAGRAAQSLIESARGAELLVVGSRGRGGFVGLLLGSVSQQCAQHPPCPVVILPPAEEGETGAAG